MHKYIAKYQGIFTFFILSLYIISISSKEFWSLLFGECNRFGAILLDSIVFFFTFKILAFIESRIKLRERYQKLTNKVPEHRMGTVDVVTTIYLSKLFGSDVIQVYVASYVLINFMYIISYITRGN